MLMRCLRTSSALEGYHSHYDDAATSASKGPVGTRYTEAATNEFDWRWTIRALRKAGIVPEWVRHYNIPLVDYVHDTAVLLFGNEAARLKLPGWRRSRLMTSPLLRHGMHYAHEAHKAATAAATATATTTTTTSSAAAPALVDKVAPTPPSPAAAAPPAAVGLPAAAPAAVLLTEAAWLAAQLGSQRPLHTAPTAQDVDMLMGAPAGTDAAGLAAIARDNGLHLT